MVTITDKLCRRSFTRLAKKLEVEYQGHFPYVGAGDAFFDRLMHVETRLHQALEKRPIMRAEIDSLELRAFKALRSTMMKVAATIEQPKYTELVHIATGNTRLIRDHD